MNIIITFITIINFITSYILYKTIIKPLRNNIITIKKSNAKF